MSSTMILQLSEKPIPEEKRYRAEDFYEIADVNCFYDYVKLAESEEEALRTFVKDGKISYVPKQRALKYCDGFSEEFRVEYFERLKTESAKVTLESLKDGIPWGLKDAVSPFDEPMIILDVTFVTYTDWCLAWIEADKPYYIGSVGLCHW